MSIINFIKKFKRSGRTLFTTPSHGQGGFIAPSSRFITGRTFYKSDYSEAEGFDNLSRPIGIIKVAQDNAATIYDSKATFFLVNGSTSGIIAAMLASLTRNDKVLIARNCHKSVYNGLVLTGAIPIWIVPHYNEEWDIYEPININVLDDTLERNKDIKMFIITNPTYEGVMTDISRVSEICKKHGVKLLVDEAHGALWQFYKALGTPALLQGADIVVQSLHKTAGALNPSALLHINKESDINPKDIQLALNLITTTSPSYPILANIEGTIDYINSEKGKFKLFELIKNINRMIRRLKEIPNIEIYSENNDITKILVKITNMTGYEVSEALFDKYNIEDEMANEKSVLFITGLGTTKSKLKKLEKALIQISQDNIKLIIEDHSKIPFPNIEPRVRYTPSLVWGQACKEVDINYSVSRICMELVCDYPPGIPLLIPGEVIKKEHIDYLAQKRSKIKVLR
ncbi:aminotransferase class I/II-fold pyridoxal phosphate-dependent enzyme [bacterium]|nr:aminotransferase class I/II-fold pyridoxal phosphate-dependent enzyme [bacterium]